jgi:hypothetical protein
MLPSSTSFRRRNSLWDRSQRYLRRRQLRESKYHRRYWKLDSTSSFLLSHCPNIRIKRLSLSLHPSSDHYYSSVWDHVSTEPSNAAERATASSLQTDKCPTVLEGLPHNARPWHIIRRVLRPIQRLQQTSIMHLLGRATHHLMRRRTYRLCVKRGEQADESRLLEKNGFKGRMVRFIHLDNHHRGIISRRRDRLSRGTRRGIGSDNGLECC